jgi:hypothetical protein
MNAMKTMKKRTKALLAVWAAVQTALAVWQIAVLGDGEYLDLLLLLMPPPLLGALFTAAFLLLSVRQHEDGSAAECFRTAFGIFAAFAAVPALFELLSVISLLTMLFPLPAQG